MGKITKLDKQRDAQVIEAYLAMDSSGEPFISMIELQLMFDVSAAVIYKILKRNNIKSRVKRS